jgi:hypothetical protein
MAWNDLPIGWKPPSAQQKGTPPHNKLRKKRAMNDLTLPRMRLYQPHNAYNIYFMLERQRLIQEMKELCGTKAVQHHEQISYDLTGYDFLPQSPGFSTTIPEHSNAKWMVCARKKLQTKAR